MTSLFDLKGKVALVTGGNGGIGLGMAEGLAMHGADVVIWGTNEEKCHHAVERLKSHGARVGYAIVDVSKEAEVKSGIAKIVREYGRLDTAIANAGIAIWRKSVFDISEDDFRKLEHIHVHGTLFTLREAARHMIERANAGDAGGSLVGIGSNAAVFGAARNEHYGAVKGGIVSMCRAFAVEFARYQITTNSVCPGWARSEMTTGNQASEKFTQNVISRVPMRRWGDPEDFAAIAVYLASPASRFHTGDTIIIDGGYGVF